MKEASLKNRGLERTLTQSINAMDQEIDVYLELLNKTLSSIDKILQRSKFVVGDIDFESSNSETDKQNE